MGGFQKRKELTMSQGMLGVSVHDARGVVADLLEKLGAPKGEEWLIAAKRFLRKENPWDGKTAFSTWKTVELGTFEDVKSLKKAFEKNGFRISNWANDLLGKPAFALASEETEVKLVKTTVVELGFPEGATLEEIYARAKELGLELCPAEVGPELRLQYTDQPYGEWLTMIAMKPITDSRGRPGLFYVAHDGVGRWLGAHFRFPGRFWHAADVFVFARK